ncbi:MULTISPECIES: MarR family transcriptional regulator [unclassified Methanoregula]|uniref:helix-turn-helix transcriptional regulator n=1 Tax=unclassified Methanoregula TaxID=2649730 RepID=UPI0009CE0E1A|nr:MULTISPECIES: MarR family transcriptional regulator [unclassified Methanoregula]OPX64573.1 MAG: MarR family protein [Methanoregula sp. PtaB.Bin085]OPY33326.1 MAG: MarR family protein [Methanoregula sp. PtaU1.Bin006]
MTHAGRYRILFIAILFLVTVPAVMAVPSYTTTYTVTVQEDSSALWQIEYRTLLASESDLAAFEEYTRELPSVYLPQVQDLMQRSAAQASVAVSRPMSVSNVTGNAAVQTSPTGRYGLIVYSFSWSGFAAPDGDLAIGDAFAGGLYLARDNTLIIRYPPGWSVKRAEPAADDTRDGLAWYGLRAFSPGEPQVTIEKPAFPLIPAITGLFIISIIGAGYMVYRRSRDRQEMLRESVEPEEPAVPLTDAEAAGLEERILALLKNAGGELHQSEITRVLGLPKSTVSSALAGLHGKGMIVKVKKGRENIIRLVRNRS